MQNLPRVLIFGQPFNSRYGGGITLSNLFRGWDYDKLAVAATGHVMYHVTTDVCQTYYQLGVDEYRWSFPFNLIQRKFHSGLVRFDNDQAGGPGKKKSELRQTIVNRFFYPVIEWLGLFHSLAKIRMTDGFRKWLSDFKPDLLYLQVSTRDTILFAIELIDYLKVPSVIHIMDDWPSTISKSGPFKRYWHNRIDSELRSLFDKTGLCLSISDAMSEEYEKRYHKKFIPFHNPINTEEWKKKEKRDYRASNDKISILYSGRIGQGITSSLIEVAGSVDKINREGHSISFHIQSPAPDPEIIKNLLQYNCTVINPVANYQDLPDIYSKADILVIANDFDEKAISFLRLSMPTKASEYMISGTPVLVYSHPDTAVSKFFLKYECGCCVTEPGEKQLSDAIRLLITDENYRALLGEKAAGIAGDLFDGKKKREEFRQMLIKTAHLDDR